MITVALFILLSGKTRYSAWEPQPNILPNPITLSPTVNDWTSLPIASTSPAKSQPVTVSFGLSRPVKNLMKNGLPVSTWQSLRFTVVANTRIRISLSFGTRISTFLILSTSDEPYLVRNSVFILQLGDTCSLHL